MAGKKLSKDKLQEIHTEAKERFREIVDFEGSERDLMEDDKVFSVGENDNQWEDGDVISRKSSGRSFLTIMRSNQFTDHIKNQQRQAKPAIKISPTDEGAQEEIAKIHQGIVRQVQYESKANQARQAGFDDAVDEGRGHWIVKTEFIPGTFKQKFVIDPITDARMVYMDIHRERPDYSDCRFGFVLVNTNRDEFDKKYPDADLSNWDGAENKGWFTTKDVVIAEYYCEMYKKRTLLKVEIDGEEKDIYEDDLTVKRDNTLNVINEREVDDPYWMWFKMTGNEIIDQERLPWKEIPIITVIGKETVVEGRWSCKGLIRDIKAPLRLYNFLASNEADIIAKAPRAPWVGAEGQFEGHEEEFADSNTSDVPYLEYKPVSLGSQMAPSPERAQYSVDLHNISQSKMDTLEDVKAITGIYDASLGQRSNETSGIAIKRREAQGNNANFHYIDNYGMAIVHEGRVINSAIGIVYDVETTVTVRDDEGEEKLQKINTDETNTVGKGNFNTTVSVRASYNTKREEEAAGMIEMAGNNQMVQEIGMGKVIRAQDWNGKDALADLIDSFVMMKYPELSDELKTKEKDDEVGVLKQQLQQAQQQRQQIGQQMQQMQEALQKADGDKQAAEAGKIQIEMQKLEIEKQRLMLEKMKIEGELQLKAKEIGNDMMKADLDSETKLKMNENTVQADLIKAVNMEKEQPPQIG